MRPEHGERDLLSTLRRKVVRPWAIVPLVVVVGGGTWWLSRSSSDGDDTATSIERTVEVPSGALDQTVSASDTIEAATVDEFSFTSSGTVTAVNVQAGAEVRAGDVLATIDSAELEAAVTQAEATVAEAEATLDDDEDAGASDARIAADESSLDSAQRQLEAAQEALDGAQLVATIDGTVSAVNITVGDQLGSGGTPGTAMTGSGSGSGQSSGSLGTDNATVPGGQSDVGDHPAHRGGQHRLLSGDPGHRRQPDRPHRGGTGSDRHAIQRGFGLRWLRWLPGRRWLPGWGRRHGRR